MTIVNNNALTQRIAELEAEKGSYNVINETEKVIDQTLLYNALTRLSERLVRMSDERYN